MTIMTIKAIKIMAKDLKPGELFSSVGEEYWQRIEVMISAINLGKEV